MEEQTIRFATVDGRRVAWAAVGEGPPLALGGWWMSHLELNWRDPRFRAFARTLARHRTVIRYDSPGVGISDRGGPPLATIEEELAVLAGVVDAYGADEVDLLAASAGGPIATAYAAEFPDRTRRLVLYGTYVRGADVADDVARESILGIVRGHWGLGSRVLADLFMPTASPGARAAFVEFQRQSAGPAEAARSLAAVYAMDVGDRLARVQAPALVLHRSEDRAIPFALGQDLAARLPNATLVPLPGADHFPWLGDTAATLTPMLEFLGVAPGEIEVELPEEEPATALDGAASSLSEREIEVLRLVALGLSDREIAERLFLSPHTVHRHVANVRTKLRLPSRAAAAAHAARLGLL
jgi:pimeloyl-ACP methyl ester carboxylesterase/DNA-binding CsgD family transcriptional regulator